MSAAPASVAPASIAFDRVRQAADPRAVSLFEDALVWDMTLPWGAPWANYETVLPRFAGAGIGAITLTVQNLPGADLRTAVTYVAKVRAEVARRAGRMRICTTVAGIRQARADGVLALILQHQDGTPLGAMPEMVEAYHALGIRCMLPVYNGKNMLGDGCAERTDEGLTRLGQQVVREMLRVGVMADATHVGVRSSLDMAELCAAAGKPLMITHSNMHAVYPHYRNVTDEQVRAAAATGGVVGINGLGEFLPDTDAGSEAMFRHLDHLVTLAGPRHAGLGLDFLDDPARFWASVRAEAFRWPPLPFGRERVDTRFAGPEQALELCDMMVRRGWPDEAVRGVLGENFLRAAGESWGG
jgi:membrane dipeptidase